MSTSFSSQILESTKISTYEPVSSRKYANRYRTKICNFTVVEFDPGNGHEASGCSDMLYDVITQHWRGWVLGEEDVGAGVNIWKIAGSFDANHWTCLFNVNPVFDCWVLCSITALQYTWKWRSFGLFSWHGLRSRATRRVSLASSLRLVREQRERERERERERWGGDRQTVDKGYLRWNKMTL